MDIKRTILWVVFIFSTIMLFENWQNFNARTLGSASSINLLTSNMEEKSNDLHVARDIPDAFVENDEKMSTFPVTTPSLRRDKEAIRVVTDLYEVDISEIGGNVIRLALRNTIGGKTSQSGSSVKLFDETPSHTYLARSGLIGGNFPNHLTKFSIVQGPKILSDSEDSLVVKLISPIIDGLRVTKSYQFNRGSFVIGVEQKIENVGDAAISPVAYMELVRDNFPVETPRFSKTFMGPAVYTDSEHFQKITLNEIDKNKANFVEHTDNGWIAFIQHYFSTAWILNKGIQRNIYIGKVNNLYRVGYKVPLKRILPGQSFVFHAQLFAGPSEEKMLANIAPGLELVKDYGWVTIVAKPLFWLLEKIYGYIGNWGWAIIVLTFLIKALFLPLSAASYRSMAKMKGVTPRIQELRLRYKDEPQKLNAAMIDIYRKEKINPLGGCLPILIQIPVFISLYWVLLSSVEMRGAPWIFWLTDLSRQDPKFVLPILMAISMFVQTKLNPPPADPLQAKMMLFMPLLFSGMFFFLPSGLVLYYVVNNVLSIAQQWYIARLINE